jgi:two-component system, OmpR family, response regulator QseB
MAETPEFDGISSAEQASPDIDVYDDGHLRVEHKTFSVSLAGTPLFLSRKEFLILSGLTRRFGRIVPSDVLWQHVWRTGEPFNSGALRVHVSNLRRKLTPYGLNIRSMVSVGYCLLRPQQQNRAAS